MLSRAHDNLFAHIALLNALDLRLRTAQIIVTGNDAQANELVAAALGVPYLDRVVVRAGETPRLPQRARERVKEKLEGAAESAAFIFVGESCSLPVTQPQAITETIAAMRR